MRKQEEGSEDIEEDDNGGTGGDGEGRGPRFPGGGGAGGRAGRVSPEPLGFAVLGFCPGELSHCSEKNPVARWQWCLSPMF